jgi:hypothetical protein
MGGEHTCTFVASCKIRARRPPVLGMAAIAAPGLEA